MSTEEKPVVNIGKECKFVVHIPKEETEDGDIIRPDMHIVKELEFLEDGTTKKNLRIIKDFQKPFYITKPHFQNHEQKKESESIDKLNKFYASESDMLKEVARKLGARYQGKKNERFIKDNPFIYGLDVTARTYIKKAYIDKFGIFTPYEVCVLDIENEIDGDQRISVISITMGKKTFTTILEGWLEKSQNNIDKINLLYKNMVPQVDYVQDIEDETIFCKTEVEMIQKIFKRLHEWQPDILEIWNIMYDIDKILECLEKNGIDPKDIFSDPSIPKEYRYFKLKKGKVSRMTEKGVHVSLDFYQQWHTIIAPCSFAIIDGASAYYYIRQGGKKVPTGYGMDSIIEKEVGKEFKKLKLVDGIAETLEKADWHIYMSNKRKHEYVVYNKYDTRGPLVLDGETKDLAVNLPVLSGYSPFEFFNSNPIRIVEALHFFYEERGWILGSAPTTKNNDKLLGLDQWVVLLPSYRIKPNGSKLISESASINTLIRLAVGDAD